MPDAEQKINRPGQPIAAGGNSRLDTLIGQLLAAQVAQRGVTMSDSTIRNAIKLAQRVLVLVDGE